MQKTHNSVGQSSPFSHFCALVSGATFLSVLSPLVAVSATPGFRLLIESSPAGYEPVRARIAAHMAQRFRGWCNDFDRQFDWHSRFFLLYCNDQLVAGLRLVLSGSYWPRARLPLELSSPSAGPDSSQYQHVAEFSGLWFSDLAYGRYVCAIGTAWGLRNLGDSPIYAIYEAGNKLMQRIYTGSLGLVKEASAPIGYPGFEYRESPQMALWNLAVDLPQTRQQRVVDLLGLASLQRIHDQVCQGSKAFWMAAGADDIP